MEAVPANIKQVINDLADKEKSLSNAGLADLSNLNIDELNFLSTVWSGIEVDRRRKIISRLFELAEENFELNFDSIFKNCLRDHDAEVRAKAIEGLWENEETVLISPYIRILNEDSSEVVQAAAAKALSKFALLAELKKLGPSSSSRVSEALLSILRDKSKPKEVWRRAMEAAAPLSHPEVKKAIDEAYRSSEPALHNSAIYAMGKNCDSSWMPILIKEMASSNPDSRYESAGACGEICDEEAVPHLMKLVQDKDPEVQQAAVISLGKIGGAKAKQFLLKCRDSADEIISEAAVQALKEIESGEDSFTL
jgi:HEAT repeat protein